MSFCHCCRLLLTEPLSYKMQEVNLNTFTVLTKALLWSCSAYFEIADGGYGSEKHLKSQISKIIKFSTAGICN